MPRNIRKNIRNISEDAKASTIIPRKVLNPARKKCYLSISEIAQQDGWGKKNVVWMQNKTCLQLTSNGETFKLDYESNL